MEINAIQVKELREKTSLGLMDCKKALKETAGDIEKAIIYLKEKGLLKAAEKRGRLTKEGLISIGQTDKHGIIIELTCETDFVARTKEFINGVESIKKSLLAEKVGNVEAIPKEINLKLEGLVSRLGENINLSRVCLYEVREGEYIEEYLHQGAKIGVMLKLKVSKADTLKKARFKSLSKDLCMHIAAMSPEALSEDEISDKQKDEQRSIYIKQAKETKKPQNVIEKIVAGKMGQYLKEVTLLNQGFVKEPKESVGGYIEKVSKELGDKIEVKEFIRYKAGE